MEFMKYLLMLFLMFGFSASSFAEEVSDDECVDDLTTEENECESDDKAIVVDSDDGFLSGDLSAYIVWGVGVALLNSDLGSDSGTATR